MDFVYVEDIARANILAAKSAATDDIFNVASGDETSLADVGGQACSSDGIRSVGPVRSRANREQGLAAAGGHHPMLAMASASSPRSTWRRGLSRLVEWWAGRA